jgi:hypothetical protein
VVAHEKEFRLFVSDLRSTGAYVKFLNDVANETGIDITLKSLRSEADVEAFAARLTQRYSVKSVSNYRSVMRKYVQMVKALNLD